uniref:Putative O-methyltransferase n=1 Tax=uncultured marine crenarchaeote HF4000_ANIW133K13 TaxID=455572 RepID=B3T436_9ARCH|nr:putative O-methyltransferase [uncultured marine crenarchaeote HF4000_ANIW133K13]
MINEKIQYVLSRLEKDIDYETKHLDEIPSEKRLNCISKNIGMFYNILLKSINAKNILEIGMSVGYSGLWFADAVMSNKQLNGQIITIDREKFKIDSATRNFEEAGVGSLIKIREGEARKILHEIKEEFGENYFDFIFIDADKESYIEYFDLCLPLVRKGGIIGADNILFPERFNEMMADYLSHVRSKPNVQSVTIPIDNGEEVTIKISE